MSLGGRHDVWAYDCKCMYMCMCIHVCIWMCLCEWIDGVPCIVGIYNVYCGTVLKLLGQILIFVQLPSIRQCIISGFNTRTDILVSSLFTSDVRLSIILFSFCSLFYFPLFSVPLWDFPLFCFLLILYFIFTRFFNTSFICNYS